VTLLQDVEIFLAVFTSLGNADENLIAFLELESVTHACGDCA
jgi:hypothetical protein